MMKSLRGLWAGGTALIVDAMTITGTVPHLKWAASINMAVLWARQDRLALCLIVLDRSFTCRCG